MHLDKVKNILVIIFKYHGDILLASPVFSALKEAFPEAGVDVYLYKHTMPLLIGHPAIRDFFGYDQGWKSLSSWQRVKEEARQLKAIRARQYDITINLTRGDRGAIVSKVSKAPYRVGYETDKGMAGQKHCYTHLVKWTETPRHTVERNLDTVRALGINPSWENRGLVLEFSSKEMFRMQQLLQERNLPEGEFVLAHPVSRVPYKHWPAEQWSELINKLLQTGRRVAISGGPGEMERAFVNEILSRVEGNVENLLGAISLRELGLMIKAAKLLVTVDSAPLHMASALQTPTVAIFGPSCDVTWGPWRNPHAQVVGMPWSCSGCDQEGCGGTWISDCLRALPVERVWHAIEKNFPLSILGGRGGSR